MQTGLSCNRASSALRPHDPHPMVHAGFAHKPLHFSPQSHAQVANNPFNYSIANVISPRPNPEDHVDRDCRALDCGRRAAAVKWMAPPELQRKGVHDLERDCRAAVVNWTVPSELLPRECATSILAAASSLSTGRRRHQNRSRAPDKACAWSAASCCDHPSTLLRRMLQLVVFTLFCLSAFQMMYKFTHLRMFFQKGSAREYWDMQTKPRTKKKEKEPGSRKCSRCKGPGYDSRNCPIKEG
ncbi:hypothetical protein PVAP13_4KG379002 [Panicum virgatum]|uniref:Uncharacterized protein n=1 Tax=Panicum virgatum TaxID=38727 RepID=A0A8T0TXX4_PANVG|nr:hypothetical protein PVAP13_4KG379002 [Panicum virgatum]